MAQQRMRRHVACVAEHFDVVEIEEKVRALPGTDAVVQMQSLAGPAADAMSYSRDVVVAKTLVCGASARVSRELPLTSCLFEALPRAKPTGNAKELLRAKSKHFTAVLALQESARHSFPGSIALEDTEPRGTL